MKKVIAFIMAFVMVLSLAACGSGGQTETTEPKAPVVSGDNETNPKETGSAEPTVLRVGVPEIPDNMDPGTAVSNDKLMINFNVFDTLVFRDNYGDGEMLSYIAESWETIDGYSIKVKLKEGITFHNGEALTAEDVKFSVERVANDDGTYINSNIQTLFSNIEGVEIVDDLTLIVKSKTSDPVLLDRFSTVMGIYIVPKDYCEEVGNEAFGMAPVGSGPYKVVEYSPEKIVLEYYEGYYGEKPAFDRVEYLAYPETSTRVTALMTGEIDMCFQITSDNIDQIEAVDGLRVDITEVGLFHLLCFNSSVAPMDDINLRKALSLSIDRELIAETVWGGYAHVRNGYNFPEYGDYYIEDYPEYVYDVELAKEYLAKSDYAGEPIIYQLRPGYYTLGNEVAEAIVSMWNAIGVNAVVEYNSKWEYDVFHVHNWSNSPRFYDPVGGLWTLWGAGTRCDRNYWLDGDTKTEFFAQAETLQTSTDFDERYEANRRMMELWDDEAVGTILFQISEFCGMDENLVWTRCPDFSVSFRAEHLSVK